MWIIPKKSENENSENSIKDWWYIFGNARTRWLSIKKMKKYDAEIKARVSLVWYFSIIKFRHIINFDYFAIKKSALFNALYTILARDVGNNIFKCLKRLLSSDYPKFARR